MKPVCSIFIPAYNAEKTIESVISRIPVQTWEIISSVFVINDGSTDKTAELVEKLKFKFPKIKLISFQSNCGYGTAVATGLEECLLTGPDYIVCLHADGQYPPEKIGEFITYMNDNRIDILQGSRHKESTALAGGMPLYKYLAGKILVWFENIVFGMNMTDFHSGFMFYSKKALEMIPFSQLSDSFDFDLEMIILGKIKRLNISELSIPTRYEDETSYLNPITYGLRILRILYRFKSGYYNKLVS